jgi:hypothetical protein
MYKRVLVLFTGYCFWHITQLLLSTDISSDNSIIDRIHNTNLVNSIISLLNDNHALASANFILTSFLIDINMFYVAHKFLLAKSGSNQEKHTRRTMFILLVGFVCRQICQYINRVPKPENMIWFDPGVPAILVTYIVENDFFFSGHTYVAITSGLFIIHDNTNLFVKIYGTLYIIYEILFVLFTRSHYFMDIYGAVATYFMISYFYDKLAK